MFKQKILILFLLIFSVFTYSQQEIFFQESESILIEAEEGTIIAPFVIQEGYIYQNTEITDPAISGRVSYQFTITQNGEYSVSAIVDAPDIGANSIFVNIDEEPVSPLTIWDVDITLGFEERTLAWRGGTDDPENSEFSPKTFLLSEGIHELIIIGREKNMLIDKIKIDLIPEVEQVTCYDKTGDNKVNLFDLIFVVQKFDEYDLDADVNIDGEINIADLLVIANNFGECAEQPSEEPEPPIPNNSFYVSKTGSDSNPGTSDLPWLTIQKAANTLQSGESAIVLEGTYNERIQLTNSGQENNSITLTAQGTVITQGFKINSNYIKVTGFEVTNNNSDFVEGVGIYITGSNCEINGNYIHETPWIGIELLSTSTNCLIKNNVIEKASLAGIRVKGTNHLIESNDISRTIQYSEFSPAIPSNGPDADGIRFFGSGHIFRYNYIQDIRKSDSGNDNPHIDAIQTLGPASNILFEKNTFYLDRGEYGSVYNSGMIEATEGIVSKLTFNNNIFRGAYGGFSLGFEAGNSKELSEIKFYNNNFIDLPYYPIIFHQVPNSEVKNNIFYNTKNPYFYDGDAQKSNPETSNNLYYLSGSNPQQIINSPSDLWQIDPLFEDFENNNYHPLSNSPLIDSGTNVEITSDFEDVFVPQGSEPDIGIYEKIVN